MIISSPSPLFTQRETQMPLLQTSLHIRSASAAWENTNQSAAAAMPTRILLIISPPDRSCGQSWLGGLVPEVWALAIRRGGKAKRNHCAEQHAGGRVGLGLDWQRPRV